MAAADDSRQLKVAIKLDSRCQASSTSKGGSQEAPIPAALRSSLASTRPAGPPADHHTAEATTRESAKTASASPSRRCAGSSLSSRAPLPTARAAAPSPRAVPSQIPRSSRQIARAMMMSSGGRRGVLPRGPAPRAPERVDFAGARRPFAGVDRVPERARDRPPLVEVGTYNTLARLTAARGH